MAEARARHAAQGGDGRWRSAGVLVAAAAAGGAIFAAGWALAPTSQAVGRTQATSATPTPTPSARATVVPPATTAPSNGPTAAARALRANRDLAAGDSLLYYPEPYGEGVACTFVAYPSPTPTFARVNCGAGEVNVRVCDIASTTPYRKPGA